MGDAIHETVIDYVATPMADENYYANLTDDEESPCYYWGTIDMDVRFYLIGVFGTGVALTSIVFNTFLTVVFLRNRTMRATSLYYFGILAIMDVIMGINYIALMSVAFYMDYFESLALYHMFLFYLSAIYTESYIAMFCSTLLVLVATVERFLKVAMIQCISGVRHWMETNRSLVSLTCVVLAISYKLCVFFEVQYVEKENCTGFERYEVSATELSSNMQYRFWFMFIVRNAVDRLIPFFLLVFMNFYVISTLKREHRRRATVSKLASALVAKETRTVVRDATRALVAMVSLYLLSQVLQVVIIFWEVIDQESLAVHLVTFYSYANDVISIMTLLSSCLRLPVYCITNNAIRKAARNTFHSIVLCRRFKDGTAEYSAVNGIQTETTCALPAITLREVCDDTRTTQSQKNSQTNQTNQTNRQTSDTPLMVGNNGWHCNNGGPGTEDNVSVPWKADTIVEIDADAEEGRDGGSGDEVRTWDL